MLKDSAPFDRIWLETHSSSWTTRAIVSFVHFLERRLGAEFVYDTARIGYESPGLVGVFELAEALRAQGVISVYGRSMGLADEPRMAHWNAKYGANGHSWSSGSSLDDDRLAFTIALAEALERYVWSECTDQFPSLRFSTVAEITKNEEALRPDRFAGYRESQIKKNSRLQYGPNSSFAWVKGYSWTKEKPSWVPVQIVSGNKKFRASKSSVPEPMIRMPITTGLAVHPQMVSALLSGALEVIERDAYIIMWLNQLSLPRMNLDELSKRSDSLARLLARCRRYRLEPHAIRLITDAPAYAVCVVLEDITGSLARFSLGLKANCDPARAVEGALLEALRAHVRHRRGNTDWDPKRKAADITHYDRMLYWMEGGRADHLAFLIRGNVLPLQKEEWETDTDEEHFERIVAWCREREYELVSVSLTGARKNVSGWHIEFAVIPELQPMHLSEKFPYVGGKRLKDIPRQFGYPPREPYLDGPQPFE